MKKNDDLYEERVGRLLSSMNHVCNGKNSDEVLNVLVCMIDTVLHESTIDYIPGVYLAKQRHEEAINLIIKQLRRYHDAHMAQRKQH